MKPTVSVDDEKVLEVIRISKTYSLVLVRTVPFGRPVIDVRLRNELSSSVRAGFHIFTETVPHFIRALNAARIAIEAEAHMPGERVGERDPWEVETERRLAADK
jgi:hypothetical protein